MKSLLVSNGLNNQGVPLGNTFLYDLQLTSKLNLKEKVLTAKQKLQS